MSKLIWTLGCWSIMIFLKCNYRWVCKFALTASFEIGRALSREPQNDLRLKLIYPCKGQWTLCALCFCRGATPEWEEKGVACCYITECCLRLCTVLTNVAVLESRALQF